MHAHGEAVQAQAIHAHGEAVHKLCVAKPLFLLPWLSWQAMHAHSEVVQAQAMHAYGAAVCVHTTKLLWSSYGGGHVVMWRGGKGVYACKAGLLDEPLASMGIFLLCMWPGLNCKAFSSLL
eukprot:1144219-Pelagomonas_calceolata.AAC.2